MIPVRTTEDVSITASLYEAATGKELGAYEVKSQLKTLFWLPLLPATPFTLSFGPTSDKVYDSTFRDIFIQVARELQGRALPAAVDPSQLEIKATPVPHTRREIRYVDAMNKLRSVAAGRVAALTVTAYVRCD